MVMRDNTLKKGSWLLGAWIGFFAVGGCSPLEEPTSHEAVKAESTVVSEVASAPDFPLGLYVKDGQLMRNGEEFRAMGINYNTAFYDVLKDPDQSDVAEGLRILKQDYDIPFIRFSAGPFAHTGWKLYVEDPEEYLRRFDVLVKHAEEQGVGLIPSLFWFVATMPDLAGEPLSALGDPDNQCRTFMRKYIRDVVGRYKDSPAVWGWEVGNEWMLFADLPEFNHLPQKKIGSKVARTAADKLLRPMLLDAYADFYKTVREIDPDRIIVTGDSIARPTAWHNRNEDKWGQDTQEQWAEIFRADTPDCYEVASFHLYAEAEKGYFKKKDLPIEGFVNEVVGICREAEKVIWCGELGMPGADEAAREMFYRMMRAIEDNQIDISAIWNFTPKKAFQGDWDITPTNERAYMLDTVKELNERFAIGDWK
jgi:hypothetical protein